MNVLEISIHCPTKIKEDTDFSVSFLFYSGGANLFADTRCETKRDVKHRTLKSLGCFRR